MGRLTPQQAQRVKAAAYAVMLLLALLPLVHGAGHSAPEFAVAPLSPLEIRPARVAAAFACEDCLVSAVHGANLVEKLDGGLLATWFGGSREGGKDVALWGADYSAQTSSWSRPRRIVGPEETSVALGRYIKTVGNSVLVRGKDQRLWLYYVSVSVGGWAGSALNVVHSADDGKSWSKPQRLITSPFFNVSTLNKCTPVQYSDGSIGLPVYHEFIGKFAELLRLDGDGNVLEKIRISQGRHSIQPLLLPLDAQHALALMRDTVAAPGRVLLSSSADGGQHWSADEKLALPNPDSAVAGLRRPDGSLLLVFNDLEAGRNSLALAVSRDAGKSWKVVRHFEQSAGAEEYSYPYLIRTRNGNMELVYTWNRKRIRHVEFDDRWVDGGAP